MSWLSLGTGAQQEFAITFEVVPKIFKNLTIAVVIWNALLWKLSVDEFE